MTSDRSKKFPLGPRFWLAVFLAAGFSLSNPAIAGAEEDYDAGYKSYLQGDMSGAMGALKKASDSGHLKAMVLLAEIYDISDFDEDAIKLYRKAAERGDPDGMFGLAAMLASGEGLKTKDPVSARPWFEKAAALGHVEATKVLAEAYLRAGLDLKEADRNSPEALRWVRQAADNDYLPAVEALAAAYRSGNMLSVSVDQALADEYSAKLVKLRGVVPTKKKRKKG